MFTPQDLSQKIKVSCNRPEILSVAQKILDKVNHTWNPSAVYCWCDIQPRKSDTIVTIQNSDNVVNIDFGYSIKFLTNAVHWLASIYTAGSELENESKKAAELGWGLSPFLSPGSVHGWELAEQKNCAHYYRLKRST